MSIPRAELMAILIGLRSWYQRYYDEDRNATTVTVISDSQYAVRALTEWHVTWMKNGWRLNNGKPVNHIDIIQSILKEFIYNSRIDIHLIHVPRGTARSTDPLQRGNYEADRLAREIVKLNAKRLLDGDEQYIYPLELSQTG